MSGWKQKVVVFAGALGAPGLFLISFLDSSVLTFPVINDLLLIDQSVEHPSKMPLYALMAASGSVLGCLLLYYIARKGGEEYFKKKAGHRAIATREWLKNNGFAGLFTAAMVPPPMPFKIFVFAAGAFEQPIVSFTLAIALARIIRYFGIGYLAVRYGGLAKQIASNPWPYLASHWWQVLLVILLIIGGSYAISRLILKSPKAKPAENS
jgi:membrane protein YqaA with SNARE-associated domain